MGVVVTLAAAGFAWCGAAGAQATEPQQVEGEIYGCGSRIRQAPPGEEAMALGRRLAGLLDRAAIAARIGQLIAPLEQEVMAPRVGGPQGGPVRAVSWLELPRNGDWGIALHQRAVERVALVYARTVPIEELQQMVRFFESTAGQR